MITILCVMTNSNYNHIPNLDLWDINRNAYNYTGNNIVITHAPCQQWSKMKSFAKENKKEKELAFFCYEKVQKNGGIFEHPAGSNFFKIVNIPRNKIISVNQHWWGFPAQKKTYLYFNQISPLPVPLNFNAVQKKVINMAQNKRSLMTTSFCQWLVDCCNQ